MFSTPAPGFSQQSLKNYEMIFAVRMVLVVHICCLKMLGLFCSLPHLFYFTTILYIGDTSKECRYINQESINEVDYLKLSLDFFLYKKFYQSNFAH
jgi:hypothetical protein